MVACPQEIAFHQGWIDVAKRLAEAELFDQRSGQQGVHTLINFLADERRLLGDVEPHGGAGDFDQSLGHLGLTTFPEELQHKSQVPQRA